MRIGSGQITLTATDRSFRNCDSSNLTACKEATAESPGKAPDYDAAELAEANAMLVKMLRASKATANEQPPTIEDVEPPAK